MAKIDEKRREKILNGNMWGVIISICSPLFLYYLFTSIYSFVDMIFANEISTGSVSSVAALSQIKNLLSSLGGAISAGGAILVARQFGAGDFIKAKKYANVMFSLITISVTALALICIPLAYPICKWSGISSAQANAATGYFIVQIIDLLFVAYNGMFIALQKSKGNTKSIFLLNVISMIVKLIFNYLFIYVLHVTNIIWIAIATLLSQVFLFSILSFEGFKKDNIFRITLKEFSLAKDYVKRILQISIPIFIGKFVFSFGKVIVNSIFGAQYLEILKSQIDINDPEALLQAETAAGLVVGALAVSGNMNGMITSPCIAFEEAESTIISQNLGNKNMKRAIECFFKTFVISCGFGAIGYILVRFTFQDELISIFNTASTPEQAQQFMAYVKEIHDYDSLTIPALAINCAVLGVLYGFGRTKTTMVMNIARLFVFRIPTLLILLYFFPELGVSCAGISMGISNIGIAVMGIVCLIVFLIKLKKESYKQPI